MRKIWICQNVFLVLAVVLALSAPADVFMTKEYTVAVSTETYDPARGLQLDLYVPTGTVLPPLKPALVLAHGGAWVQGSRTNPPFTGPGGPEDVNTPMQVYALEFAKRGYVCAAIDYRLYGNPEVSGTGLLNGLNLQPITDTLNALLGSSVNTSVVQPLIESGVEDLSNAVQWMVDHAGSLGVDPTRIAVGGYSAGAFNALFAGYLDNRGNISAVWANSGALGGGGNEAAVLSATTTPVPAIVVYGALDEVVPIADYGNPLGAALIAEGIPHVFYTIPDQNHYYTKDTLITENPAKGVPDTVENLLSEFMYANLSLSELPPPVDPNAEDMPAGGAAGWAALCVIILALASVYFRRRQTSLR
jgi:dienelactone hydrolase